MKDILEGNWNQMKSKVKEQWGKLTDDDLTQINVKKSTDWSFTKNVTAMIKLVN